MFAAFRRFKGLFAVAALGIAVSFVAVDMAEARRASGGFGSRGTRTFYRIRLPAETRKAAEDLAIETMGDKIAAKSAVSAFGVPVEMITLPPFSSTSLGHLSASAVSSGRAAAAASRTASAATKLRVAGGGPPSNSITTVEPMKLPAPSNHARPCRPRPAVWRRATSQRPSAQPSPVRKAAARSALVEPVCSAKAIKP